MIPQITEKSLLIPRITRMPDGRWRPEVVVDDGPGDIIIGEFVATREEAERAASQPAYDAAARYR